MTITTDEILTRLDANEELCKLTGDYQRRQMAYQIWLCERNGTDDVSIHGRLGRIHGFHVANATYPGSAL